MSSLIDDSRIIPAAEAEMQRQEVPGVCVAAIDDGQVAWTRFLGDVETTTVFEAASLSKPVFAAGVLRMAERDGLDLDASLAPLLPEPPISDPRVNRITARMVLCHMSGFPNGRDRPDEQPGLLRDPGIEFGYSGEGYFYLQRAVEGLMKPERTFSEVMREEVFSPLGLLDTSFVWLERYEHRFATGHDDRGRELDKQRINQGHAAQTLHTTAPEFAAFMCAVLMSGRLLQPKTVAEMLRPHVEVREDWGCGPPDSTFWGLGWGLTDTVLGMSAWQWGWNPGFRHFAIAWPERQTGLVVLTDSDLGLWVCKAAVTAAWGMEHPAFRWLEH